MLRPVEVGEGMPPRLGQPSGDARRHLLHLRGRQDQGKPPLLRLADAPQADRRAAQVTATQGVQKGAAERGRPLQSAPYSEESVALDRERGGCSEGGCGGPPTPTGTRGSVAAGSGA